MSARDDFKHLDLYSLQCPAHIGQMISGALDEIDRLRAPYLEPHAHDHLIEFRNDGWTIQHTIDERVSGTLFDCPFAIWDGGDIGYRGRYVLYHDEDGQLNIGGAV